MPERPGSSDPTWFDAWRGVLFSSAKVLGALEGDLQAEGSSLAFFDVMGRLHDAPGMRLRMLELQSRSLFTRSGMTRLIDRMEMDGLVRRDSVPGDRRGVYVTLTGEGLAAHARLTPLHLAGIEREFAPNLTSAQQREVADALWGFWHT